MPTDRASRDSPLDGVRRFAATVASYASAWIAFHAAQSKAVLLSAALHAAALTGMAAFTYEILAETEDRSSAFLEGDELFESDIDTSLLDFAAGASSLAAATPEVTFETDADLLASPLETDETLRLPTLGEGSGTGAAFGDGSAAGGSLSSLPFARPSDAKVVTKGSFTAYTIPADPQPRQDYVIVIEIRVPRQVRRYPRADISGVVIGTDDYRQPLPGRGETYPPRRDGVVQLAIPVPGARELVRDTIMIRSRILKEDQQIELTF